MLFTEAFAKNMLSGTDDLWRNIAAMPVDKMTWKAETSVRSTRELLDELVSATNFTTAVLKTKSSAADAWVASDTLSFEELEPAHRKAVADVIAAVSEFPDAELSETVDLPWGKLTYFEVASYAYWNLMYHLGQIAYVQTLYGDGDFH
ncbi:hypothetical protein BH11PAT4_BH11PAT4_3540 [soil metagenome]